MHISIICANDASYLAVTAGSVNIPFCWPALHFNTNSMPETTNNHSLCLDTCNVPHPLLLIIMQHLFLKDIPTWHVHYAQISSELWMCPGYVICSCY